MTAGQKVMVWGIFGGPYHGIVKAKGTSKDCWIVRYKHANGISKTELHQDYIKAK